MSFVESGSRTFSVADIGKVLDCFAADFDGIAQSTGLRTRENAQNTATDVKSMALRQYLKEVNIFLTSTDGVPIRAAKYEVSTNTGTLKADRPGNFLWPRTPGGELNLLVTYTKLWIDLSPIQKAAFKKQLFGTWGPSDVDPDFPMLTRSHDRSYVSNGYGMNKSTFK